MLLSRSLIACALQTLLARVPTVDRTNGLRLAHGGDSQHDPLVVNFLFWAFGQRGAMLAAIARPSHKS